VKLCGAVQCRKYSWIKSEIWKLNSQYLHSDCILVTTTKSIYSNCMIYTTRCFVMFGRTWLVYYGCFWSQHVHTVHVFWLMFQLFPLMSPQAIHWWYPTTKSPQWNPLIFSEFSLISLQKCNNVSLVHTNLFTKIWTCIFMNIAKILNGKFFQSFHNVKGKANIIMWCTKCTRMFSTMLDGY